jgi:hypothetical protein
VRRALPVRPFFVPHGKDCSNDQVGHADVEVNPVWQLDDVDMFDSRHDCGNGHQTRPDHSDNHTDANNMHIIPAIFRQIASGILQCEGVFSTIEVQTSPAKKLLAKISMFSATQIIDNVSIRRPLLCQ